MRWLIIVTIVVFFLSLLATAYIYLAAGGLVLSAIVYMIRPLNKNLAENYLVPVFYGAFWGLVWGGLIGAVRGCGLFDHNADRPQDSYFYTTDYIGGAIVICTLIGAIGGLLYAIITSKRED